MKILRKLQHYMVPVAALGLIFFFDWRLGAASLVPMLFAGGLMAVMIGGKSQFQAGISELIRNKTVLVIAHRMRTVIHANRIVVMDNGHIAESGSPEDLLQQNGIFARMVNTQQGK